MTASYLAFPGAVAGRALQSVYVEDSVIQHNPALEWLTEMVQTVLLPSSVFYIHEVVKMLFLVFEW